jgi:hypothetical protein
MRAVREPDTGTASRAKCPALHLQTGNELQGRRLRLEFHLKARIWRAFDFLDDEGASLLAAQFDEGRIDTLSGRADYPIPFVG